MKSLFKLCLVLIFIMSGVAQARSCENYGQSCTAYCKSSMCRDACGRGQTFCKASGCKKANAQCEAQCAELDSWDAQENCYNACWTGAKKC